MTIHQGIPGVPLLCEQCPPRESSSKTLLTEQWHTSKMKRGAAPGTRVAIAWLLFFAGAALADSPADRFVAGLANREGVPAEAAELLRSTWAGCDDCDGEEFLTQGLTLLSERFLAGLDAYDAQQYEKCATVMGSLVRDDDPFLAISAAVYQIKALVALEQAPPALEQIDALLVADGAQLREFSYFAPEVAFLRGYALLLDLKFDESQKALRAFLTAHPAASERLRMSASQMLAELANRSTGDIGEVADLMGFSGRRLASGDTGTEVQERQQRILDLLDKLVENAENNENNSGGGGSSGGRGRSPQSPLPRSVLPPGSAEQGTLREARRASPGEVWGNMPPADRERILQALRESFPDRYRRLVEQYYEELAKKP